jgi:hypothetical protein
MLGFGERAVVSLGLGAIMVPLALLFVSILFRTPISALPAAMTITLLVVVPLPFVWRDVLRVR